MIYYFLGMNIFSFILFGIDKKRSKCHAYRISEKVLLLVTFLGGTFGSLFAIFYFHHKNRKMKFLILVPLACFMWTIFFLI